MTAAARFKAYVDGFRARLVQLATARGAAMLAVVGLCISIGAVLIAGRLGFPAGLMIAARVTLFASLAFVAWRYLLRPRRRLAGDGVGAIEERAPQFAGRVAALREAEQHGSALTELLAEDSLAIAAANPPDDRIPGREIAASWGVAGLSAGILLFLAVAGPGNFAYGVRDLWVGWAMPGLLPPQGLAVTPGDSGVRLGGNLRIEAVAEGFSPEDARINVRFTGEEWQEIEMNPGGNGFDFTFYAIRRDLEYYVAAGGVRSPSFDVSVVDLPAVEKLAHRYEFPAWSGRAPEERDPAGDVRAIAETRVKVLIETDRALPAGDLIVDDQVIPLVTDGTSASAVFEVTGDGQYHVAARVGGEHIRLTDDYFIRVEEDEPPEIEFERPGGDWSATRIEEVTARINARDDLRLDGVELHYSVNGGDWAAVELEPGAAGEPLEHVFYLESLSAERAPLEPGDLVSYYAVARDREQETRTDIFFIDVQPFDRRYSQSQAAGGGGQGGQQNEISQRQREIIISTWNLIRERDEAADGGDAYVRDNAALLTRLQRTLREQVETLAQRAEARQLTEGSEEIARFVEHLQAAGEAMVPAADRLEALEFETALSKAQEALQQLLAAEAVFTDINVSMQADNRARGGQAGRDISEMFELEMDLEKNQYETGSRARPAAPEQALDDFAEELAELARRQEQLARNRARSGSPQPEQRWQQEQLQREVEALRQRLEALERAQQQRASANRQQGQSDAESGREQQGEPQSGQRGEAGNAQAEADERGDTQQRQVEELQRRLQSALRAMEEADAEEAGRQLEGARDSANEAQRQALQARFDELAERAGRLQESQAEVEERLQGAVRRVLQAERNPDDEPRPFYSGLDFDEEQAIAEEKRAILGELQQLQQDARSAARSVDDVRPETADDIREAIDEIQEQDLEARIAIAAAYIEQGEAVYVAPSESAVTEGLRDLSRALERAARDVGELPGLGEPSSLERALANARELRQALEAEPRRAAEALDDRAQALSREIGEAMRTELGGRLRYEDANTLRQLADELRIAGGGRDPAAIVANVAETVAIVEQLELELNRALGGERNNVRTQVEDEVPDEYREIVADYYRRLGRTQPEESR